MKGLMKELSDQRGGEGLYLRMNRVNWYLSGG